MQQWSSTWLATRPTDERRRHHVGGSGLSVWVRPLASFTSASSALDARIATIEQTLTPAVPVISDRLLGARSIQGAWDDGDLPTKRAVLSGLIDRVVVNKAGADRFDIHWRD